MSNVCSRSSKLRQYYVKMVGITEEFLFYSESGPNGGLWHGFRQLPDHTWRIDWINIRYVESFNMGEEANKFEDLFKINE